MKDSVSPEDPSDDRNAGTFRISISDETFQFQSVEIPDQKVTGTQIAQAAGKHPVEDDVVLQRLKTGELETLRPTELVDLAQRGVERFFVIKGANLYRFFVNGLSLEWPLPTITGEHIRALAGISEEHELLLEREDTADDVIDDDQLVDLSARGVERFKTRPAKDHIIIFVDGEPFRPPSRVMTPNEIIVQAERKNPAENYLVQITHGTRISYKDKGYIPIKLRNGMKFQIVAIAPTPVSDSTMRTGVAAFVEGLKQLGYNPTSLPGKPDHVMFEYTVESGTKAGQRVTLGLIVPSDFSMTPPSGPHVSPRIHPIKTESGPHPTHGVHLSDEFQRGTGKDWQYWSRPFPGWANGKKTVAAYMSHIWQLWDSQ